MAAQVVEVDETESSVEPVQHKLRQGLLSYIIATECRLMVNKETTIIYFLFDSI